MRVAPLDRSALDAQALAQIAFAESLMGFEPNDALVMARHPALLSAISTLVSAVYGPGKVHPGLKRLIGEAASRAAGCFYCSAHAAAGAHNAGVDAERITAVWNFEESNLFSDAEKAAIRVAMRASVTPNAVEDADFEALRKYFDDDAIVEIVAVIAMFGFLNRWNSTLQTALEPTPAEALERLSLI
ncbi:MAG: carboxymuconolactone decarboxylase family protein [Pseudomonadota bacterium]